MIFYHNTKLPTARVKQASADTVAVMVKGSNGLIKTNLSVELANNNTKRKLGLGKRKSLDANSGMLFTNVRSFWMKDVNFPLDIMFIDNNSKIIAIKTMAVEKDKSKPRLTYTGPENTKFAIEVNAGWCSKNKVAVGDFVFLR